MVLHGMIVGNFADLISHAQSKQVDIGGLSQTNLLNYYTIYHYNACMGCT